MAILKVLLYPHSLLRQTCPEVPAETIKSDSFQGLLSDMLETMYFHTGCVGLAAPQVGQLWQVFAMDARAGDGSGDRDARFLINPRIISLSRWKSSREGCLSFPDYLGTVKRARRILVSWLDEQAVPHEQEFLDFEAVIVQHETDHLHGIMFIDRVRNAASDLVPRQK